jgi:hypothetical protein
MDGTEVEFLGAAKASPISLSLDDYEDIFSDFDPRPFSERMLSDDFLHELKRAAIDKEESGLSLVFLLPKEKRNAGQEPLIKERLRDHFRRHRRRLEERYRQERKTGFKMVALGVVFMFIATYFLSVPGKSLWSTFAVVLLEPAGWFTFWEGLNLIVFQAKEITPDLGFYRKMTGAKISFTSGP